MGLEADRTRLEESAALLESTEQQLTDTRVEIEDARSKVGALSGRGIETSGVVYALGLTLRFGLAFNCTRGGNSERSRWSRA